MRVKTIIDEDFLNYKKPSMYIATSTCNFKCCMEAGLPVSVCQNEPWSRELSREVPDSVIIERYLDNPITKAIVFSGLEPMDQFSELLTFIRRLRKEYQCDDDVIIYTGYTEEELRYRTLILEQFKNIIIKFGRFKPNETKTYDEVLGVYLASDNQYAKVIGE